MPAAEPPPQSPPPRTWRQFCGRCLFLAALTYLGVIVLLMFLENRLVYPRTTAAQHWEPAPTDEIQDIEIESADGTLIHAWYLHHPTSKGALLHLHGNAGNLSHRGRILVRLRETLNVSALIIDYPGYGKSGGSPSEQGCYDAADAAYTWLTSAKKYEGENVLIFGKSLGGGVGVELATRRPHRALVLIKTFTSAPDVGASFYPWLPVRWVMRNRFNSLERIQQIKTPVYIAHGDRDRIVPFKLGKRLFEAATEPKAFKVLAGQDHNDRLEDEFFEDLAEFLKRKAPL